MAWVNGRSGTYNISTNNSVISGYVQWEEQYDVVANKSLIKQTAYLRRTNIYSGATFFNNEAITRAFFFGSDAVSTTENASLSIPGNTSSGGGAYVQVYTAKKEVYHKSDGTQSITLGFQMTKNDTVAVVANSFTVPKTTATVTLTTIPRATTPVLSEGAVTMGSTMRITLSPAISTFKHKIRYEFGSLASQIEGIKSNGTQITADFLPGGAYTFTPPTSLAYEIPNAAEEAATLIVYTYTSDGTHVGTSYVSITLRVPAYAPVVDNVSVSGNNLLNGMYVQGKSTATIQIAASSLFGASIRSISAVVDGKTYTGNSFTTAALASAGQKDVVITVVDTRNKSYTYTKSAALTVYEYFPPTITEFTVIRNSTNATYAEASVKGRIATVNGENIKNAKITFTLPGKTAIEINASQLSSIENGQIVAGANFINVPTDSTLTATVTITDSYTYDKKEAALPTEAVTMDFHHSGTGVAFGKVAELENTLDVAWRIKNNSVPTLLGGFGQAISSNADINTAVYLTPGNYVCSLNDTAKSLKNTPTSVAFKMSVSNCLDSLVEVQSGSWVYLIRGITDYNGQKWTQYVRKEGGDWIYSAWRSILDSTNCPDYVIERGTYDGWEYTKWNSGKMELFGEKSLSFPEGTKQGDFPLYRSIVSLNLSGLLTKIMSGTCCIQTNGMVPQVCRHSSNLSTAEIVIVTSRTFSAFTITAPVYIVGKWK